MFNIDRFGHKGNPSYRPLFAKILAVLGHIGCFHTNIGRFDPHIN